VASVNGDNIDILDLFDTAELMDMEEAAEVRGISKKTFYNYLSEGRINVRLHAIGNKKFVIRKELMDAIKTERARSRH